MPEIINIENGIYVLRISNTCQGNCTGCGYSKYNNRNSTIYHKHDSIIKIIEKITKISKIKEVAILSDNITSFKGLNKIITLLNEKGINRISISGEENINKEYINKLTKLNVKLIYFINFLGENYNNIIKLINKVNKIKNDKTFTINIDFKKEKKYIILLIKYFGDYKVLKNGNILIKGYILIENCEIYLLKSNIIYSTKYNKCLANIHININNNKIFINGFLDVNIKGDIYLHKIPCIFGSYKGFPISNIFQENNKIINDFKDYKGFLSEKKGNNMTKICNECIKNPFNYKLGTIQ